MKTGHGLFAGLVALTLSAAPQVAGAAPAMWQVSDSDSHILVFGSIHGLPSDASDWRTERLNAAVNTADRIWFETDVGPAGIAALTVKTLVQTFSAAQGEPWVDRLTPEQQDALTQALEQLNISLEQAGAMPPWLVAMQLAQLQMQMPGDKALDASKGVDMVLEWELPAERKAYFETPGEQFDMLAGGTLDDQVAQVVATLAQLDRPGADVATLVDAWSAGDVEKIAEIVAAEGAADPDFIQRLLHDRNRNWLPRIEGMLRDNQTTLVIVGAAHLAGPGSVLALLREAGYTVDRIQ